MRIKWEAPTLGARAADSPRGSAEPGEAGRHLPRRVQAAVVDGRHLDVVHLASPVRALVFNADVGKLHVVVHDRQVVLDRPLGDFVPAPIGPPVAV